jgi:hypothetical protein
MASAGITETPLASLVNPLNGPPDVGAVDDKTGDEKNNPVLKENCFVWNADMDAGFHCKAPLISIGCAVAAPPIDILVAPMPCIICPACATKRKGNTPKLMVIIIFFIIVIFNLHVCEINVWQIVFTRINVIPVNLWYNETLHQRITYCLRYGQAVYGEID